MIRPSARRLSQIITVVSLLTLAAINQFSDPLIWTGDEPQYTYYAAAISTNHRFDMSDEQWESFLSRFGLARAGMSRADIRVTIPTLAHSATHSVLTAPAVGAFGLKGGRWAHLLVAGLGLLALLRLLRGHVNPVSAAVAAGFAVLSIPLQPYSRLLYAEVWLLLLLVVSWQGIHRASSSVRSLLPTLLPIFALPFFHLRAAPVALGLFLLWVYRIVTDAELRPVRTRFLVMTGVAAVVAAFLFATYQVTVIGSLTGGATAPEPPSLVRLPYRLGVQLFEVRHGLLANNPAMLLGFVGLGVAAYRGNRLAREGIFLFVMYLPFVVGAAAEAMPGRFWVAIMPVLIAGLAFWFEQARSIGSWVVALPLIFVSVQITGLLVLMPNLFFENRLSSFTYEHLYRHGMGNVYFAPFLPWETFGLGAIHESENIRISLAFLAGSTLLGLLLAAGLSHRQALRLTANGAAMAFLTWFVVSYSERPIAREQFSTQVTSMDDGRHQVVVTFTTPQSPRVITFGEPRVPWYPPDYPNELQVQALDTQSGSWASVESVPTRPIIGLDRRPAVAAIRIVESNRTSGQWTNSPISLLR